MPQSFRELGQPVVGISRKSVIAELLGDPKLLRRKGCGQPSPSQFAPEKATFSRVHDVRPNLEASTDDRSNRIR